MLFSTEASVVYLVGLLIFAAAACWEGCRAITHETGAKMLAIHALRLMEERDRAVAELDRLIPFAEPVEG